MVFEPTFDEIDEEAAGLPDLGGDGEEPGEPAIGASDSDDAQPEADVEGVAAISSVDLDEDDLPPYGEE